MLPLRHAPRLTMRNLDPILVNAGKRATRATLSLRPHTVDPINLFLKVVFSN